MKCSLVFFSLPLALQCLAAGYDPLAVPQVEIASHRIDLKDASRDRTLPLRVYLPPRKEAAPVVLFSHGLGGSCDNNPYLGNHWAKRGYVVVFAQHPGSDESVWKDALPADRMSAMKQAASAASFMLRVKDIPAVIDALTRWNKEPGHLLLDRLNLDHIGMSGHSFGAVTTQAVSGQTTARGLVKFTDPRIDAAVIMSGGPPAIGDPAAAFASVSIPWMLMTGTEDNSPIGNSRPADRLKVFPYLHTAPAWQIVFDKGNHMTFSERDLRGGSPREPRYHRAILALSTAFWDATLRNSSDARAWLDGDGARSVITAADVWQRNEFKIDPKAGSP